MLDKKWYGRIDPLTVRWADLVSEAWESRFDYGVFRSLAIDTFQILFPIRDEKEPPKEIAGLLHQINQFAYHAKVNLSPEYDAAKLVAAEFIIQLKGFWIPTEGGLTRKFFVVKDKHRHPHSLNVKEFDLSCMI